MNTQAKVRLVRKTSSWAWHFSDSLRAKNTAGWGITLAAITVGCLATLPAVYIVIKALGTEISTWNRLWQGRIPSLLFSTLSLTVVVTFLAIIIAVPAAWLVNATDLPGRRMWRWLLAMPFAIPPYIGAFAYITFLGPQGILPKKLSILFGLTPYEIGFPSIYSFGGTLLIMAFFTYPYIYLLVSAALKMHNQNLIDAARASGMKKWQVFTKVTLPLLRPSIAGGGLLVTLYVLSDFGAISLLRYPTLTSAIYQQLTGRYDLPAAASLSSILMILTFIVIFLEWHYRAKARYFQTASSYKPLEIIKLKAAKWPALIFILTILAAAIVLPLGVLIYWSILGLSKGAVDASFWHYTLNSVTSSSAAATAAVFLALPVVYLASRKENLFSRLLTRIAYTGYALPGVVVGLGLVFFVNSVIPLLYGTVSILVLAYVVRFLPQCLQSEESALTAISPNIEEAARSLGCNSFGILRRITIPLMLPALAAGWSLVFVSAMKELAATLLLRPPGFNTLAVRIWSHASEGYFIKAGPTALLLVLVSTIVLAITASKSNNFITEKISAEGVKSVSSIS